VLLSHDCGCWMSRDNVNVMCGGMKRSWRCAGKSRLWLRAMCDKPTKFAKIWRSGWQHLYSTSSLSKRQNTPRCCEQNSAFNMF